MVQRKIKSKRLTTRHRAKVAKKVREHKRKLNKESKLAIGKKKPKKDPGVPVTMPGREEFIQRMQAEQEKEKMQRKLAISHNDMHRLAAQAAAKQASYSASMDQQKGVADKQPSGFFDPSKKAFYREFLSVVENADVILEVLDARDPEGSRVKAVEELVAASGGRKRIVLVLNKIDLVPREAVSKWLVHLRRELPAVAFRASTAATAVGSSLAVGECLGADTLLQLLKNYCRSRGIKTSVRVGVVGYPNVGKSSLINSLKRSKVCRVGATPGMTTATQEIHLDRNITLLDCPGIVFASPTDSTGMAELFLRNCVRIEQLEDPIAPVQLILEKIPIETIMHLYTIPRYADVNEFLSLLAKKMGRLKKGGVPNLESAAKAVLDNWNQGKIPFYTNAPVGTEEKNVVERSAAEVVAAWAPEFDIDAIGRMEVETVLSNVPEYRPAAIPIVMESDIMVPAVKPQVHEKEKQPPKDDYDVVLTANEMSNNPQLNRARARQAKLAKKAERRAATAAAVKGGDNDSCSTRMMCDDAYDFATDFYQQ